MVETFFKSIKAELIWRNRWDTRRQEKPETGSLLDQYGLTQKPKTAPPKLETQHEYTGQLV